MKKLIVSKPPNQILKEIFDRLENRYGPQYWWPGDTPFEIVVGAILTQSAAWTNVEKAIHNLKSTDVLSPERIRDLPLEQLVQLVRPSGYYNAKAEKLKAFVNWLFENYKGNLAKLSSVKPEVLRKQLLLVHGIGKETADSIVLYAVKKPVFVIDAYTIRIISRIGLLPEKTSYEEYQIYFMQHLPADVKLYNEFHALLVRLGKEACRKIPVCFKCGLNDICKMHLMMHEITKENRPIVL